VGWNYTQEMREGDVEGIVRVQGNAERLIFVDTLMPNEVILW
jgi:hypothetical protein